MGIRLMPVKRVFGARETAKAFIDLKVLFLTGKFKASGYLAEYTAF